MYIIKNNWVLPIFIFWSAINFNGAMASQEGTLREAKAIPFFLGLPIDVTMACPAHSHGTPEEAMQKLEILLKTLQADKISSVWVCRANQVATLKMFAPAVGRIYINPFVSTRDNPSDTNDLIWPGLDHPFINRMRILRSGAEKTNLVACIDLRGEPIHFRKRIASFEEIRWMVFAVIGANFQGITWRSKVNPAWANRFEQLEDSLRKYRDDLGAAHPVDWVEQGSQNPASATCGEKYLFICLLHPDYLRKTEDCKDVTFPLNNSTQNGAIILRPPEGVTILSGQTLSGRSVSLKNHQGLIQVEYNFTGGGDMLILPISKNAKSSPILKKKGEDVHG